MRKWWGVVREFSEVFLEEIVGNESELRVRLLVNNITLMAGK
jgi:hypothetical protein